MFMNYKLDPQYPGPIYKQIAENISRAIVDGQLPAGCKLPTVRELSAETGAACGTIKHAYEFLEEQGFVEMIQGKGSFVVDRQKDTGSRKEKAMDAIDQMFGQLESLGFTPREMEIYLNLKLRGLEEKYDVVKVAVIDCNPETLQIIEKQLSQIGYAETAAFDLNRIAEDAEKLNGDYDLLLTTSTHFAQVEPFIAGGKTLGMLAMTPSVRTIIRLAKIPDSTRVGIFCASDAFSSVVRNTCQEMGDWSESMSTQLMGIRAGEEEFFNEHELIIVPEGYETFIDAEEKEMIRAFVLGGGEIVPYNYRIDRGSFLYVEEQIKRCMNRKRSM